MDQHFLEAIFRNYRTSVDRIKRHEVETGVYLVVGNRPTVRNLLTSQQVY